MTAGANIRLERIAVIARREFLTTARRREFILITLGLPAIYAAIFALVFGVTVAAVNSEDVRQARQSPPTIGFYDATHRLDAHALAQTEAGFGGRVFLSEAAGEDALRSGKVRAFVLVKRDFMESGDAVIYVIPPPLSLGSDPDDEFRAAYVRLLRRATLTGHVDPPTLKLVMLTVAPRILALDAKNGKFVPPNPLRDLARLVVPYAVSLLLLLSVLLASSYLLHGIVEEKESRVIEILVSAVSHEELLIGKLIGLGGVGMAQLSVWLVSGFALMIAFKPSSLSVVASPALVACAVVMFTLGYTLYAAIMAGIGSLGTSWRESQQIASVSASILVTPLLFLPVLLQNPDCVMARVLSLFPLTAPNAMLIRVAAGGSSLLDVTISVALLLASIYATIRFSARLFRLASLLHGQRPGLGVIWRALLSA